MTPLELRTQKGWTFAEAESIFGYSQSYISMLERGERSPSYSVVCKYKNISNGAVGLEDWAKIAPSVSTRTGAAPPV